MVQFYLFGLLGLSRDWLICVLLILASTWLLPGGFVGLDCFFVCLLFGCGFDGVDLFVAYLGLVRG